MLTGSPPKFNGTRDIVPSLSASTVVGPEPYVRPTASSRNAGCPELAAASATAAMYDGECRPLITPHSIDARPATHSSVTG